MSASRFAAALAAAVLLGAAACDGAGEHQVPDESGTQTTGSPATLQDSAVVGVEVPAQPPLDSSEINTPNPPALPEGARGTGPAAGDSTGAPPAAPNP